MMRGGFWHGVVLLIVLSITYFRSTSLAAATNANPMRAPKSMVNPSQTSAVSVSRSLPKSVFDGLLRFYQQVISEVDGARSNMYPTGSDYARRVIKKHGVALGIVMTAERLLHEGNEKKVSPRIRKYGIWRIYDPVEANDWWWRGSENWVYQPRVRQR